MAISETSPDSRSAVPLTLNDRPDWRFLLREIEALYRLGSAGGSKAIRSHRRRVRESISRLIEADAAIEPRPPEDKPVTAYLSRALDLGERGVVGSLCRALSRVSTELSWEYGYERMPPALARKYAYCEILGPKGPVMSDALILGFVLFAPRTTYPQHSHKGIEESYISISGAWSENDAAVFAPGSLTLNRPGDEHRITTGDREPCLLAYAWIGEPDMLAAPGMKLSATRKRRPPG